jgi:uncharacterized integral membrane protein
MPWRLIVFLIFVTILVFFIGFNISNTSELSLGFVQFDSVPIFLSNLVAFLLGSLATLPFVVGSSFKRRRKQTKIEESAHADIKKRNKRAKPKKDEKANPEGPLASGQSPRQESS